LPKKIHTLIIIEQSWHILFAIIPAIGDLTQSLFLNKSLSIPWLFRNLHETKECVAPESNKTFAS
jgi:hypothetical protein